MANGELTGIQIASSAPKVNHLLFADDSLLFCKATISDATIMKSLLDFYCNASVQKINNEKSFVFFGKGCPDDIRLAMKQALAVPNESLKYKYLGHPSDVGR